MGFKRTYTIAVQVTTNDPERARKLRTLFQMVGGGVTAPDGVKVTEETTDGITTRILMERLMGE